MTRYTMKLGDSNKEIRPGKLGGIKGVSPRGETLGFTNYYMMRNSRPIIPVVGEFHYARFSYLYWEEELLKMQAGGINIVATYVFWNFHEEAEGIFEWSNNRNLRYFIDLCAKHDLPVILRIGPFCHGEIRNGGIPDWVFRKPLEVRSNDPQYLALAERLYREIARQIHGMYMKDGGPIIGVQLENEYMHAGAPFDAWGYKSGTYISAGRDGNAHMDELRRIAEEAGIRPAFYTATAWGQAAVPERDTLPMLAGYAYTPWIPNQPPSREYIYRDLHMKPMEKVNYPSELYPVAYCEMAGGMQVSYSARPYVAPESVEAMTLVKLASGSNLLGYYMYHGGSNPVGKYGYLNESGLPKITYDYQSPLGEFGRVRDSYDRIRTVALMMEALGELIAPMGTLLPEGQSDIQPEDTDSLRWCVRQRDGSGFLFMNNFQDHLEMPDRDVRIELDTPRGKVAFPYEGTVTLRQDASVAWPFHLDLAGSELISATAQPLTVLDDVGVGRVATATSTDTSARTDAGTAASMDTSTRNGVGTGHFTGMRDHAACYIFYAQDGIAPEFILSKRSTDRVDAPAGQIIDGGDVWIVKPAVGKQHVVQLHTAQGNVTALIVLSRAEALQTYRLRLWGREQLLISNSRLYAKDEQLICTSPGHEQIEVSILSASDTSLKFSDNHETKVKEEGWFLTYETKLPIYEPKLQLRYPSNKRAVVGIDAAWPSHVSDVFMEIDYDGDVGEAFLDGELLTDHIHYGETWHIGLKQCQHRLQEKELHLSITPLRKGKIHAYVNQAYVERFEGVEIAEFYDIRAIPYYTVRLTSDRL